MTANTRPLRAALIANAMLSAGSAATLLVATDYCRTLFPVPANGWLQALGLGLLVFAFDLIHQATRRRMQSGRALLSSLADLLWVAASIALLLAAPQWLSPTATRVVLWVALAVLGLGLWQLYGIHHLHWNPLTRRYRHCLQVAVTMPAARLWPVLADLGDIARYMPSLSRSEVIDGRSPGPGAIRECEDLRGRRWREVCTAFEPERGFTVRFVTDADGFPYPATTMEGGWQLDPAGSATVVRVWWELRPRPMWMSTLLLPVLAWQADRRFPAVVAAMARAAGDERPPNPDTSDRLPRLLPNVC